MDNISESIILGVVSGILTSFVIWLIIKLFQKIVLPWYQNFTYQGLKISGSWVGFYENKFNHTNDPKSSNNITRNNNDPDYSIHLKQKGHIIYGTLTRNKTSAGERDIKEFEFEGLFRNGDLVFYYKPKDQTRLGLGCYVMKLADDGRKFEGSSLYIASNRDRSISQFPLLWVRQTD